MTATLRSRKLRISRAAPPHAGQPPRTARSNDAWSSWPMGLPYRDAEVAADGEVARRHRVGDELGHALARPPAAGERRVARQHARGGRELAGDEEAGALRGGIDG